MTTAPHETDRTEDRERFTREWQEWSRRHAERLADPHGFLAVTGLHWLTGQAQRFPDAPGSWSTGPEGVVVELADGEEVQVEGRAVRGRHVVGPVAERGGVLLGWGEAVLEVARRGGRDVLRPRHPDAPLRQGFTGTPAYAPDPRWRLAVRYLPFDAPRPTTVGAAVEGLEHVYDAPGEVEFEVEGSRHRLTVFPGQAEGTFTVLFTDATSGVTTYAANRSAVVEPDGHGGHVLDLNRAANLPCAYTDLATCPLPPRENRLPFAVEAGQKLPRERGGS